MNKRLLFAGVSTIHNHAGQHKLYFLADALSRWGISVSVVVPDAADNRRFLEERPEIESHYYTPAGVIPELRKKAVTLAHGDWSAVWIVGVGLRSLALRGWWASHTPLIKDFDEFPSLIPSFGAVRRIYLRAMERMMIAQADAFTCASAFLENSVRRRRPGLGDRLLRLPVAISAEEHRVDAKLAGRLRSLANGRPVFLYIGTLSRFYEEQVIEVLQLADRLERRGSNAIVRILGDGPDAGYFKARARMITGGNAVEFWGHIARHELPSHMEAASVLLFPFPATPFNVSRCPTKAYHYAAANRPVVTNYTGEIKTLFGDSAWYYPERKLDAFADCCVSALSASSRYDNRLDFTTLTWQARARTFQNWLERHDWIAGTRRAAETAA